MKSSNSLKFGGFALLFIVSLQDISVAQSSSNLTPPTVSSSGEITGFTPTQAKMVKQKAASSPGGSACGQFIRGEGWSTGTNFVDTPEEFTVAIETASTSLPIEHPMYNDDRYLTFKEAWIKGHARLAEALEVKVATDTARRLKPQDEKPAEQSASQIRAGIQTQLTAVDNARKKIEEGPSLISKGKRLLNEYIDRELRRLGHDPDAAQKAALEANQQKKQQLLREAEAAAKAAEKLIGQKEFTDVIQAVAKERMKGVYTAFTTEAIDPSGKGKSQFCVVLKYSPKSEALADMMASRDFTNAPSIPPNVPLSAQLPDPSTNEGLFQLVTMWGLNVYIDQNGDVNLVSFAQAGVEADNELAIDRARSEAALRAQALIRLFINQTVAVKKATKASKTLKEYEKNIVKAAISKRTSDNMEQGAGFAPINGMNELFGWSAVHPISGLGIEGSVYFWNASIAAGAIRSKARQNAVVKDTGGASSLNRQSLTTQPNASKAPATQRGTLKGSTKSATW